MKQNLSRQGIPCAASPELSRRAYEKMAVATLALLAACAVYFSLVLVADALVLIRLGNLAKFAPLDGLALAHGFPFLVTWFALLLYLGPATHRAWCIGAALASLFVLLYFCATTDWMRIVPIVSGAIVGFATWTLAHALRLIPRWQAAIGWLAITGTYLTTIQYTRAWHSSSTINRFALVSGPARTIVQHDFSRDLRKDNYPLCEFRYNSLGYRDIEPSLHPGRSVILLVGDSFVFGDGIAVHNQTLGALLRARLEDIAPQRFDVVSAAYPGLGLYGYGRIVDTLIPAFQPSMVIVGYLGNADFDPLDVQVLCDWLAPSTWLASFASKVGTLQDMHRASASCLNTLSYGVPQTLPAHLTHFSQVMQAFSRASGRRALLIDYFSAFDSIQAPVPIEVLALPAALRYQGRSDDLWYAKDVHPRAALNRRLASILGDVVIAPKIAAEASIQAPVSSLAAPQVPTNMVNSHSLIITKRQEPIVGAMLGLDGTALVGCRLVSSNIRQTYVEAKYHCRDGNVMIELRHPSEPSKALARTKNFAVVAGQPPPGSELAQAVVAHIRQLEASFSWEAPESGVPLSRNAATNETGSDSLRTRMQHLRIRSWVLLAILTICGSLLLLLRRGSGQSEPSRRDQ